MCMKSCPRECGLRLCPKLGLRLVADGGDAGMRVQYVHVCVCVCVSKSSEPLVLRLLPLPPLPPVSWRLPLPPS